MEISSTFLLGCDARPLWRRPARLLGPSIELLCGHLRLCDSDDQARELIDAAKELGASLRCYACENMARARRYRA